MVIQNHKYVLLTKKYIFVILALLIVVMASWFFAYLKRNTSIPLFSAAHIFSLFPVLLIYKWKSGWVGIYIKPIEKNLFLTAFVVFWGFSWIFHAMIRLMFF